jgi:hypothetical protein
MNIKNFLTIAFIITLAFISGFATAPVSASAPTQFEIPVDWSGRIDNPCGFHIYDTSHGIQRSTYWYDETGKLTMGMNFFNITGSWEANGKSLEFSYNYSAHGKVETYPEYYIVFLGISPHITLAGVGSVVKEAGYLSETFTMDKKGNLDFIDVVKSTGVEYADWDAICAYLAP